MGFCRLRPPDRPPLNLRLVSGELELPQKKDKKSGKGTQTEDFVTCLLFSWCIEGILRRDWPSKYLERVPALIVLFLDLDWDHSSWNEKKTEAESKCASLRSSAGQASRLAVVLLQQRYIILIAVVPDSFYFEVFFTFIRGLFIMWQLYFSVKRYFSLASKV